MTHLLVLHTPSVCSTFSGNPLDDILTRIFPTAAEIWFSRSPTED